MVEGFFKKKDELAVLGFWAVRILSEMMGRHMFFVDVLSFAVMLLLLGGLILLFKLPLNQVHCVFRHFMC